MSKEKNKFNGKCPECNGVDFEMIAGVRVSARYDITIVGNTMVSAEFNEITDIETEYIEKGSELVKCSECGCEIPMDELENEVY